MLNDWAMNFRSFSANARGNVLIVFALCSTMLLAAMGGAIDLARSYNASQTLTEVANLACQYASRPSVLKTASPTYGGANGGPAYVTAVNGYISASLQNQKFGWSQTNAQPFTYIPGGAAQVSLASSVPTSFAAIVNVPSIAISATSRCYDNASSILQRIPDANSPYLLLESFESAACNGCYRFHAIPGHAISSPTSQISQQATFNGFTASWYALGHCLETDAAGVIKPVVPDGTQSAELDCDNGSGTAGNSSISTQVYLPAGRHELRYFYSSRVSYPNYTPAYLCGSVASDLTWANDNRAVGGPVATAVRTNQVNVYLDINSTGSPPLHTTIDGVRQLAGGNLIDTCVYSLDWIERSVRINVGTAGYYWLSFAADGHNDSYGAQVDYIRLCPGTCPGTLRDNFPATWLAANNGGQSKVLFRDTFESPVYPGPGNVNTTGNLNNSMGTSGASSGWPGQNASGWATAPYNQMDYNRAGSAQGTQSIELDATNASGGSTSQRLTSRAFLLDPGYYRLEYKYISGASFASLSGVYCGAMPASANISGLSGNANGVVRYPPPNNSSLNRNTNILGVFMAHAQLASTPVGGGALNAATSYTNPNGTVTTTPTVAPNGLSLTNYNSAQPNPLLDICGYATAWQSRSTTIKILKPAYYWLTFAALGAQDRVGATIDDVALTAIGSLYGSTPPGNVVAIPVPAPQPDSTSTPSGTPGFSFVANPLTPPAP